VKPATFVVANTAVGKLDNLKADDVGVWEHKGKPGRSYQVSRLPSGEVYGAEVVKESGDNVYDLVRVYYHHKHTPTFRRTLFYIKGKNTVCWETYYFYVSGSRKTALTTIQHTFSDGIVVPIKMAPHGNSVTNKRLFYRTQSSTLDHMNDNLSDMAPKAIINETYEKARGSLSMSSCSEVRRNLRQVYT